MLLSPLDGYVGCFVAAVIFVNKMFFCLFSTAYLVDDELHRRENTKRTAKADKSQSAFTKVVAAAGASTAVAAVSRLKV